MTNRSNFDNIANRILNTNVSVMEKIANRLKSGEHVVSSNMEEKLCFDLIKDVDFIAQQVNESVTAKRFMRNKI